MSGAPGHIRSIPLRIKFLLRFTKREFDLSIFNLVELLKPNNLGHHFYSKQSSSVIGVDYGSSQFL